ncbi:MAG: hypothetical protein KDI51_02540 [Xanthomonadales bacterium]|nr:hypothetical protein [Xanthomonadales bacterium]
MKMTNAKQALLAAALLGLSSSAFAGAWVVGTASGAAGTTAGPIDVTFAGDGETVSTQIDIDFNPAILNITGANLTAGAGSTCTMFDADTIRIVVFDFNPLAAAATTRCTIQAPIAMGAPNGPTPLTANGQLCAISGGGAAAACTATSGSVTVQPPVGNVPPTLTYMPNFGTTVVFPNGAPLTVTDATIAVSGASGSGSGLDATARVTNCAVSSSFSPPGITCQAGTTGTLDFTPGGADPGDINCSCVVPAVGTENAQLSCEEISPASGSPVVRIWDLTCSGGTCGTLAFNPPLGAVNFTGGAASITVSHTGGTAGTDTTFNSCIVSGANAANFAITNSPINFNFPGGQSNQGTISLSCNNSTTTDVTATLSCNQICDGTTARTWTLNCPGQTVVPPDAEVVPVPTLGDLGRILMAAMLLLLGMGAVTIRNRG